MRPATVRWHNRGYSFHTRCDLSRREALEKAADVRTRNLRARAVKGAGETYCVMVRASTGYMRRHGVLSRSRRS